VGFYVVVGWFSHIFIYIYIFEILNIHQIISPEDWEKISNIISNHNPEKI